MTWLTRKSLSKLSLRLVSIVLACIAFGLLAFGGANTWIQAYADKGSNIESILAALVLIIYLPGGSILLIAFYFLVYLREAINNLIGISSMFLAAFIHVFISIPAVHSDITKNFLIGSLEIGVVATLIFCFHKYVYKNKPENEQE